MVRASLAAENAGIRSVSVATAGFERLARRTAETAGVSNLALAVYPGVIMTDTREDLRDKVEKAMVQQVLDGLAVELRKAGRRSEPAPRDIVFEGTLDEVQEHFTNNLWSDGLPIVPPTLRKVESFLAFTDRHPGEVIGVLGPENRQATIWNVAVNGVMAGCRPEYMPILVAIVEALADPKFCVEESGGTPGWEPLVVVNGPIVKELNFNFGAGAMKIGRQANSSVGRFLKLYMRNIPGLRIEPGLLDKGSIGYTFNVAMAENEDAVAEIGWEPFSVDRGFRRGENVVTVQSVRAITAPIYTGNTAADCADAIADIFGTTCSYSAHLGMKYRNFHPLLLISPSIARVFAREGWTKARLRSYLYDNTRISAAALEKWLWRIGHTDFSPEELAGNAEDGLVRVFLKAEDIGIVVAGDPDRNQARGYVHNHKPPASRRIELPKRWPHLLGRG